MNGLQLTGSPPTQTLPELLPAPSEPRRYAWHHAVKKMAESDLELVLVKEFFGDYQIPKNESDRQQLIKLITNARNDNPLFETERAHFLSLLCKDTNELNSPPASSSSSSSTMSLPQTTSSTLLKCWAQYVKNNFAGGTDTTMLIARIVEKDLGTLVQCDYQKAADLMLAAAKELNYHLLK